MTVSAVKIIQPGEIQSLPDDETPLLVLPVAKDVFKERAARLAHLSDSSPLKDWLFFCSQLASAQSEAVDQITSEVLDENVVKESLRHGVPPTSVTTWKAGSDWDEASEIFIKKLSEKELLPAVRASLDSFSAADAGDVKKQAEDFLRADEKNVRPEWAPFIGAILQMIWTKKVEPIKAHAGTYRGENSLCPVCGSHPVASVVRVGSRDSHRYLNCSLCSTEWYGARARCTNCDTPKEVSMLGETKESLIQGECCDDCQGYLKIMYQSRDPMMEVVADDLASIQADFALSNEGYQRTGRNMFFMVGSETDKKDS